MEVDERLHRYALIEFHVLLADLSDHTDGDATHEDRALQARGETKLPTCTLALLSTYSRVRSPVTLPAEHALRAALEHDRVDIALLVGDELYLRYVV